MAVFFTCIILVGTGITIFALFLLLAEKHRLHDYRTDLKDKKNDLIKVIEDAEELINEMNRYSDYVVTQIEEKHSALTRSISDADSRIELLNSASSAEVSDKSQQAYDEASIIKILQEENPEPSNCAIPVKKGKVLTFDLKRREIIKLAKSGLDSTEIARRLNCGKGEIELIAKIGRQP
jgi:hypothetical protein